MPDVRPDTGPSFRLWPPVSVGVPLCSASGTVNLAGYTFTAWVNFTVTSGTVPMNAANLVQEWEAVSGTPTRGTAGVVAVTQSNLNTWLQVQGTVNQASTGNYLAGISVGFPMADVNSEGFSGTMFVDDVRLSPP